MSDESTKEMDSDLKEYLAYFKGNTGRRQLPTTKTSSSKARMYTSQTNNKTVENLSLQKSLTSSEEDSLSKDSSFLNSTSHKKFNLKDVNDLQTSHTISEVDDVTLSPTNAGQDDDTASAVGKLVLSLKELGSVSEDTALSIDSEDINTSSFNVKANVFTVDELVAASDAESIPTNDKNSVADDVMTDYKTTGVDDSEANSYKDDFEEEGDDEDTIVEESIASDESIKELISSSVTEIQSSSISNSNALTNTNISSSPNVSEDSIVSETEETQTSQHSSTSKDTYNSKEHSPSKHEVCCSNVNPCY